MSLAGLSGAGIGPAHATGEDGPVVTGIVRDALTQQPLQGVCVTASTVWQTCGETGVFTDATGAFRVSGVNSSGTTGWLTLVPADGDGFHVSAIVDVALTGDETDTVLDLAPAGAISGVVLDAVTNAPIAGVCPNAYTPRKHYQFNAWLRPAATVSCSDARGVWSLSRLPVGKTVVSLTEATHRASFVPAAASALKARQFTVKAGRTLRAPVVPLSPGARLTLKGETAEGAIVRVVPAKPTDLNPERTYEADSFLNPTEGQAVIANLAPGSYLISVSRVHELCDHMDEICSPSPDWYLPTGYDPALAHNVTLSVANPMTVAMPQLRYRQSLTLTFPDIPAGADVLAEFSYPSGNLYSYPNSDAEEYLSPGESLGLRYLPDVPLKLRITVFDEEDNRVGQWWYGGDDFNSAALIPTSTTALTLPLPTP